MFAFKMLYTGFQWARHLYVPIFASVASLVYAAQRLGWALPQWVNNYLNDFLCMPIVLFLCRYAVRKIKADDQIRLSLPLIFTPTFYYAIYFEYYMPKVSLRYTADPLDVVLYFAGALFFYVVERAEEKII